MSPDWSNVTPEVANSVEEYMQDGFQEIQDALRKGKGTDWAKKKIADIDKAFARAAKGVATGSVVYRAMKQTQRIKFKEGSTFKDLGFTSTTSDPKIAKEIQQQFGSGTYLLEIKLPAYERVLAPLGAKDAKEVILNRGGLYRIEKVIGKRVLVSKRNRG